MQIMHERPLSSSDNFPATDSGNTFVFGTDKSTKPNAEGAKLLSSHFGSSVNPQIVKQSDRRVWLYQLPDPDSQPGKALKIIHSSLVVKPDRQQTFVV